jgi:hypothetical protein
LDEKGGRRKKVRPKKESGQRKKVAKERRLPEKESGQIRCQRRKRPKKKVARERKCPEGESEQRKKGVGCHFRSFWSQKGLLEMRRSRALTHPAKAEWAPKFKGARNG